MHSYSGCPIKWCQQQWLRVTLNVTFAVRNLSNSHALGNIACINYNVFTCELESMYGL